MMQSGGGDGFGDPIERDQKPVAEDVREGYASASLAHSLMLTTSGDVDVVATQLRRQAKAPAHIEEEAFQVIPG
jgi:N-methylhydantoinase B